MWKKIHTFLWKRYFGVKWIRIVQQVNNTDNHFDILKKKNEIAITDVLRIVLTKRKCTVGT